MIDLTSFKPGRKMKVHFSSETYEWATPLWLFDYLNREFAFTLDPCATQENAKCKIYFTREQDGLSKNWGSENVFVNPPYGRSIYAWVQKSFVAAHNGATVVCLLPSRTDTKWWHTYVMRGEIRLLRGRLRFGEAPASAPFPSAIVVFRPPAFRLMSFPANGNQMKERRSDNDLKNARLDVKGVICR